MLLRYSEHHISVISTKAFIYLEQKAFYMPEQVQVHYPTTAFITCPGPSTIDFGPKWCKLSMTLLKNKQPSFCLLTLWYWEVFQVAGWHLCLLNFLKSRDVSRPIQAQVLAICLAPDFKTSCLGTSSLVNPCQCKIKPSLRAVKKICCHMNIDFLQGTMIILAWTSEY